MSKKFVYVNTDGTLVETPGAFESSDFVNSSAGAGDAGKPILLDSGGLIDASMISFPEEDVTTYTAGTGGVTKGDLVYISANDEVLPYATLTDAHRGIGLAKTSEIATASVSILANDTIITGVLTAATAGDIYYWDGSALTTTQPAAVNQHVIQAGIAKNATDLHIEVKGIKKNSAS